MAPPRDNVVHDTLPRPPAAGRAPPFKGTWFHPTATIPHQRRSPPAGCFAVSSHTVAFGGIRFCSPLAHGHFWRRSPLYSIPAHGRFWLLAHDHLWQLSSFTVFSRTPSQASNTRSLVAAFAFSQSLRTPLRRVLAHDRLWQLSPFHRLLAYLIAGSSHKITCGRPRLFTAFSRTPSQASRTQSLVAAFAFPQSSWAPLRRLLTHDRFWQLSPCCSLLVYPFTGFSHMIAFAAFAFPQCSCAPLCQLLTHDRLSELSSFCSLLAYGRFWQLSLLAAFSHTVAFSSSCLFRSLLAQGGFWQRPLLPSLLLRSPPAHSRYWQVSLYTAFSYTIALRQHSLFTTVLHTVAQPKTTPSRHSLLTHGHYRQSSLFEILSHPVAFGSICFCSLPTPGCFSSIHSSPSFSQPSCTVSCGSQPSRTQPLLAVFTFVTASHSCPWQLSLFSFT